MHLCSRRFVVGVFKNQRTAIEFSSSRDGIDFWDYFSRLRCISNFQGDQNIPYNIMKRFFFIVTCLVWVLISCKQASKTTSDSASEGTIHISVDETFRPIMEEQIKVYQSSFPKTQIIATYKPEADCWNDMMNDSTRMVIVTNKLTEQQAAYYYDSLQLYPQSGLLAFDAIALVVNRNDPDSVFTTEDVIQMLKGKSSKTYGIVFDGIKATSTVRYFMDSVLKTATLNTSQIMAARTSRDVVQYIAGHKGFVGFVGVSWIGNPEDPEQLSLLNQVRIAWVSCTSCKDSSFTKPWQEEILTKRYPYSRGIYYVLKENHNGLGKAFVNFMKSDRGQLIFRRGYVVPARRPFLVRETQLKLVKP